MQIGDYGQIGIALAMVYLGFMNHIAKRRVESVAAALEIENKKRSSEAAAAMLESQKQTAIAISTHKLVNSQMGEQKRLLMVSTAIAYSAAPNETNRASMEKAEAEYRDHQVKQRSADEAVGTLDVRTKT